MLVSPPGTLQEQPAKKSSSDRQTRPPRRPTAPLGLLALVACCALAGSAAAVPETQFLSGRMAVLSTGDAETLVVVDALGSPTAFVPLEGQVAIPGPGDYYALLSARDSLGVRAIDVRTLGGSSVGSFGISDESEPTLGASTLALTPAADRAETAYDLQFLSLSGGPLGSNTIPGSRLLDLQAEAGGSWTATSMDGVAGWGIHRHAFSGSPLWTFPILSDGVPIVSVSPSGSRTAIGTLNPDPASTHLDLLDGGGAPIRSDDLDEFSRAVYDTAEDFLALGGVETIALLDAQSGSDVWFAVEEAPLAVGRCLAFSRDSDSLFVIEQERMPSGGPEPVWLVTYADIGGSVQRRARVLTEVPSDRRACIIDFLQLPDRRLRIVAQDSLWIVIP